MVAKGYRNLSISPRLARRKSGGWVEAAEGARGPSRRRRDAIHVILKANKDSEAGILPGMEIFAEMGKYNESWLRPASCSRPKDPTLERRTRPIRWKEADRDRRALRRDQGVDWRLLEARPDGGTEIELRQVFETADFGAEFTPRTQGARGAPARRGGRKEMVVGEHLDLRRTLCRPSLVEMGQRSTVSPRQSPSSADDP